MATNQTVNILTPIFDGGDPRTRKDLLTLKLKIDTGNSPLAISLGGVSLGNITADGLTEVIFDLTSTFASVLKSFNLSLTGAVADFVLNDITVDYNERPAPLTSFKLLKYDFGEINSVRKRVRVWPFEIDTLGNTIYITPYVNGIAATTQSFSNSDGFPRTFLYQFITDVFGTDYGVYISTNDQSKVFEIYKIHPPTIVQALPIAKRYDQVGVTELFRYGKIRKFYVRLIPFGGTVIPYNVLFQDTSQVSGSFTVVDGKEDTYEIGVPKTTAGQILRLELGPTSFDFHRTDIILQVAKSGKDTENELIPLDGSTGGGS